jgi:hypothetical protein
MTVTELIEKLQEIKELNGDQDMNVFLDTLTDAAAAEVVDFRISEKLRGDHNKVCVLIGQFSWKGK